MKTASRIKLRRNATAYFFLSPWLLSFLVFGLFPILFSFYLSFTDTGMLDMNPVWRGLDNYIHVLKDKDFLKSLWNTLYFVIVTVPITTVLAMILAVAVNSRIPGKVLFRVGFFMPTITSIVVVSMMFMLLYAPSGILNAILDLLHLPKVSWLLDVRTALPSIMAMSVWTAVGFYMLMYVAALQSIPKELYEAATTDGAGLWTQFRMVTLPHLRQMSILVIVMNTINSLQVFSEVFVMTKGGPLNSTKTIVLYMYNISFSNLQLGKGSAVAYLLMVFILIVTVIQMGLLRINKGVGE
ncbi:carbohydrate ABC transporter permease [Paenibacillus glycanilyticus]|uniref:ABC transporter permease n=1 Tax=Paenibacillus glycanilyticus TaxID=126569 RepID=A0ABQ6GDK0_9BACL|nr:sugar ABC transporter permease [Paenibacillus glycanilyticus]GLX67727.1 ABC transporter permease [Paenibacillus glycanilyticus]